MDTWLKVEKKLPEPEKRVLVANAMGYVGVARLLGWNYWVGDDEAQIFDVTHWSHLLQHPAKLVQNVAQKRETVNYELPSMHTATTIEQRQHVRLLGEILSQKRNGDWVIAGQKLGVSALEAEKAFCHSDSPLHSQAVKELDTVISERGKERQGITA